MTMKKHILSLVTKDHSGWVEKNDYDLENYEEIRANAFIVVKIKQFIEIPGLTNAWQKENTDYNKFYLPLIDATSFDGGDIVIEK